MVYPEKSRIKEAIANITRRIVCSEIGSTSVEADKRDIYTLLACGRAVESVASDVLFDKGVTFQEGQLAGRDVTEASA